MGYPRVLKTAEQVETFKQAWEAGESAATIARTLGFASGDGVHVAAQRLGLRPRTGRRKVVFRDDAQVEAFKRDWRLAMPLKEIAALHGFRSEGAVSTAARGLGLPPRRVIKERIAGSPTVLRPEHGRWVAKGGISVWQEAS